MHSALIQRLKERLKWPLPGFEAQKSMLPQAHQSTRMQFAANARNSAVLLVLFPKNNECNILLIERSKDGKAHSGQIAFPGGKQEEGDKNLIATALREAEEETGLDADVRLLGLLSPVFIPVSNYKVQPVLAWIEREPAFVACEREVARVFSYPLHKIFKSRGVREVYSALDPKLRWESPVYLLEDDSYIWGATAMILAELEALLSNVL